MVTSIDIRELFLDALREKIQDGEYSALRSILTAVEVEITKSEDKRQEQDRGRDLPRMKRARPIFGDDDILSAVAYHRCLFLEDSLGMCLAIDDIAAAIGLSATYLRLASLVDDADLETKARTLVAHCHLSVGDVVGATAALNGGVERAPHLARYAELIAAEPEDSIEWSKETLRRRVRDEVPARALERSSLTAAGKAVSELIREGSLDEAWTKLTEAVSRFPRAQSDLRFCYEAMGKAFFDVRDYDRARAAFKEACGWTTSNYLRSKLRLGIPLDAEELIWAAGFRRPRYRDGEIVVRYASELQTLCDEALVEYRGLHGGSDPLRANVTIEGEYARLVGFENFVDDCQDIVEVAEQTLRAKHLPLKSTARMPRQPSKGSKPNPKRPKYKWDAPVEVGRLREDVDDSSRQTSDNLKHESQLPETIDDAKEVLSADEDWQRLTEDLASCLPALKEGEFLILAYEDANCYVQFASVGAFGMRIEAASNDYIELETARLSPQDYLTMDELGWHFPNNELAQQTGAEANPDNSPNFFVNADIPIDFDAIAALAVQTLRGVYRIRHPGLLVYMASGFEGQGADILFPSLRLKLVRQ